MNQVNQIASELWQARNTGSSCTPIEGELSLDEAYKIQTACTSQAPADCKVLGYKIGATNEETLGILGLSEPFFGPLYSSSFANNDGPAEALTVPLFMQHKPRVEAEFVVSMKNAVRRTNQDLSIADIEAHIDWVAPGIEIVASRFSSAPEHPGSRAVADFGANQFMVVGQPFKAWQTLDLSAHPVTLNIDDQPTIEGHSGLSLYGNPLGFVCWLLNQPAMHNVGLKAGEIVSCGTCTGAPFLEAGNNVVADYGVLGRLALNIESQTAG